MTLPLVSVVLPARNEERFIAACLDSILATSYPTDRLEVLVVDGMSEDATRAIAARYAARVPFIRVLDNPGRIVPTGLNTAIRAAVGDLILRMDAHVTYPPDYIPALVAELQTSGADNVGGVVLTQPGANTATARAIAIGLSHPLGVGNAHFRIGTRRRRWVDTVPFGCYRREMFERIGGFDEELARDEDDEFNFRMRRYGGRILLVPHVSCCYYARATLGQVARMFHQYGYYKPLVARKVGRVMTARQLVPPLSLLTLVATALMGLWWAPAHLLGAAMVGTYAAIVAASAVSVAVREGLRCGLAFLAVPPVIHVSYGFGYVQGIARQVAGRSSMRRGAMASPVIPPRSRAAAVQPALRLDGLPTVSIVMPCRNEAPRIAQCLDSIVATRFPLAGLEILIVDGRSDDGTRDIVAQYAARHPQIRLLDNPARITPTALNIGIRAARGEIIVRMDAHVTYPPEYLPRLITALEQTQVDNVGGVVVTLPADDTPTARAIALAVSHPLGVGNSYFRIGSATPRAVDTVPFGCYRRSLFDRIGMFDEDLVRNQDDEFNFRLLNHGGRILLLPSVTCSYYTRGSLRQVARTFYQYGYFKPLVARKAGRIMTARQLVPSLFLVSLATCGLVSAMIPAARVALALLTGVYGGLVLGAAALVVRRHGARCAGMLAATVPLLHVSYGTGFLVGLSALWRPQGYWARKGSALPVSH